MLHDMRPIKYRTLESREDDCNDHPQTRLCRLYYFFLQYIKINIIFNFIERSVKQLAILKVKFEVFSHSFTKLGI